MQFELNDVWELVDKPNPKKHNINGIKWIFHSKQDENGIVVRNKARLVAQGYTQVEGIDSVKHMLLLHALRQFTFFSPMQITMISCYIKWM